MYTSSPHKLQMLMDSFEISHTYRSWCMGADGHERIGQNKKIKNGRHGAMFDEKIANFPVDYYADYRTFLFFSAIACLSPWESWFRTIKLYLYLEKGR
jgi:hypothetical protein